MRTECQKNMVVYLPELVDSLLHLSWSGAFVELVLVPPESDKTQWLLYATLIYISDSSHLNVLTFLGGVGG